MAQVLVVCGATATGKTELAAKCAKLLGSAVISADSQLVYRGLDIGTAKPREEEKLGVPHYMIDVTGPADEYSVSDYREAALPVVERYVAEGKIPVICGGTGFYINSLLFDFSYGNVAADPSLRKKYEELARERGREAVYAVLVKEDPKAAKNLHPNDLKRVIRALEIKEAGGMKKSEMCDGTKPRFEYLAVCIDYPRERLYERINARVDKMFEDGLLGEVEGLLARGIDENCRCMQAIGYKEVIEGLKYNYSQSTMRDIIKQNTRRYAKRQVTFFKKMPDLIKLSPEEATAENVISLLAGVKG